MVNIIPRWSRIMNIDVKKDDVKKGLIGIVVDETTISKVMPDINSLTYRGYLYKTFAINANLKKLPILFGMVIFLTL